MEKGDSSNYPESLDLKFVLDRRNIGCPLGPVQESVACSLKLREYIQNDSGEEINDNIKVSSVGPVQHHSARLC
jgi:hypothetical protein